MDSTRSFIDFGEAGMALATGAAARGYDRKTEDADPTRLRHILHIEYLRETRPEGVEMVMGPIMCGALGANVKEPHSHHHVPAGNTAVGHIVLESSQ